MEMRSGILRCISDLKLPGNRIWLDDFDIGFAGLSWLRPIDFDTVKIDRSFCTTAASRAAGRCCTTASGWCAVRKILIEGVESIWS